MGDFDPATGGGSSSGRRGRAERLRIERLEREKARLERELEKARLIIDVQKKVAALLGIELAQPPKDGEE